MTVAEKPRKLGSIAGIETSLAAVLEDYPSVRAAWLFGSVVAGDAGPLSDVDVAVLGCAHLSLDERARLAADLARAVGRPVDLVSVERASPVLGIAIVDTGRRILCRDIDAADAFEDSALRRYLGTAALRRIVNAYVREDLRAER